MGIGYNNLKDGKLTEEMQNKLKKLKWFVVQYVYYLYIKIYDLLLLGLF